MIVTVIQGANYGDAWPDGPSVDSTSLPSGYPDDALLFTRLSGDDRIAGKGHTTSNLWYWDGSWRVLMTATTPNFPVAFHPKTGELYIALGDGVHVYDRSGVETRVIPGYVGSQGIRQVNADGSIQTGDATYGDGIVSEYTDCGDVRIGQGHDGGGIVAIVDGTPRLVLAGAQQMVKVNRVGDDFAIYGTDFKNGYRIACTRAELAAIPPIPPVSPLPAPSPLPLPVPPKPPAPVTPPPIPQPPIPAPSAPPVPYVTPKGPTVIHVDGNPGFSGDEVDNGDGSFAIKKANGHWATKNPQGGWEERDGSTKPGAWESYKHTDSVNLIVAERDGGATFLIGVAHTA